jgi:hypothetical protein
VKRLLVTAATAALAASLVLTVPAGAGGAATVRVVGPSSEPVAGVPWPLELEVLQHGITPIDWEHVSVVARQPSSGMVAAANARPGEAVGRYLVDMVFPDAGDWTLEFGLQQLEVIPTDRSTVTVGGSATGIATSSAAMGADSPDCG